MAERSDIRLPPPPGGWSIMIFVDGYQAQIVGGITTTEDGKDIYKALFYPFPDLKKRYKIPEEFLTRSGLIEMEYPKEYIITLNEDDPVRTIKFCMLNFEGKETPATKWFQGYENIKLIGRLREINERLRVHNASLTEENLMLRQNVAKYISRNVSGVLNELAPALEQLTKIKGAEAKTAMASLPISIGGGERYG